MKHCKHEMNVNNVSKHGKKKKKKNKKRRAKKKKNQSNLDIDVMLQSLKSKYDETPHAESIDETPDTNESNSDKSQVYLQSLSTYTFDTIDQSQAMIDEQEIMNKFDGYDGYIPVTDVLTQVRKICDIAYENEWTYEETMRQIDFTLVEFI